MCFKGFLFVEENNQNLNKNRIWWKPAIEIFTRVSGYIVFPVILALIIGKALDSHFGTKPWIFLGLTVLAFVISCFSIVRTVTIYMKKIASSVDESPREEENKK